MLGADLDAVRPTGGCSDPDGAGLGDLGRDAPGAGCAAGGLADAEPVALGPRGTLGRPSELSDEVRRALSLPLSLRSAPVLRLSVLSLSFSLSLSLGLLPSSRLPDTEALLLLLSSLLASCGRALPDDLSLPPRSRSRSRSPAPPGRWLAPEAFFSGWAGERSRLRSPTREEGAAGFGVVGRGGIGGAAGAAGTGVA